MIIFIANFLSLVVALRTIHIVYCGLLERPNQQHSSSWFELIRPPYFINTEFTKRIWDACDVYVRAPSVNMIATLSVSAQWSYNKSTKWTSNTIVVDLAHLFSVYVVDRLLCSCAAPPVLVQQSSSFVLIMSHEADTIVDMSSTCWRDQMAHAWMHAIPWSFI